ncbi:LamG domain-containing protein [Catalinimonas sp. 4WD22]|uniref:LamG domain-containing protein n=1 Tax=Catalinimonas locisalis TaxID=3133978 RepID=UPI00310102F2
MNNKSLWMSIYSLAVTCLLLTSCEEELFPEEDTDPVVEAPLEEEEDIEKEEEEEPTGILDSTMIAYYPLDGDTEDYSGYDNHASSKGGQFAKGITNSEQSAYHITTKGDALDIPDFDHEQISVSLWYYYEGSGSFWNTLLYGKNSHHHLIVSHVNGSGASGEIGTYNPGFDGAGYVLEEQKWHHLVLTKDNKQSKIYLNGVLVYDTLSFSNATYPLSIIGNFDAQNGTQGSLGKLDEIKIYNKVLGQSEVEDLNMGITLDPPVEVDPVEEGPAGLIAHFALDGNTLDDSGFGNDAIAIGGEYAKDRFGNNNSAFRITSKSDALDVIDFNQENISVSMWYYYEGTGSFWNTLLYGNSSKHHLIVSHANGGGDAGELGTYSSGFSGSDKVLETYKWYHLVITKEGSQTKLYVDKQLVYSAQEFSNTDYPLTIIGNFTAQNGTQGALGRLDDIHIYDEIISEEKIVELYGEPFVQEEPPVEEEEEDPKNPDNSNLLAYYALDNDTQDHSGSERHAVATGGSFGADRNGNANSAFIISDKNDALDIADINNTQISVSMWYYYEGTGSFWNTLLYGHSSKHHLIISHANGSGEAGELGTYGGFKGSDKILEVGNWYHLVITKDGNNTKLYVDNELVLSVQDFSNADYPLTVIGNYAAGGNGTQGSLGKLDEIKIYGKVLSVEEVAYLYNH